MGWANHHLLHPKETIESSQSVMTMVRTCRNSATPTLYKLRKSPKSIRSLHLLQLELGEYPRPPKQGAYISLTPALHITITSRYKISE